MMSWTRQYEYTSTVDILSHYAQIDDLAGDHTTTEACPHLYYYYYECKSECTMNQDGVIL